MENLSNNQKKTYYQYLTPCGYHYKYLEEDPNLNQELRELLDAAPKYKHFISIKVTQRLYDYLEKKYHIEMGDQSEATAIFENVEIGINIISKQRSFITIGIFGTNNKKDIANRFAKELNYKNQFSKIGLEKVMDPNHGGSTSQEVQAMVSLIHFG